MSHSLERTEEFERLIKKIQATDEEVYVIGMYAGLTHSALKKKSFPVLDQNASERGYVFERARKKIGNLSEEEMVTEFPKICEHITGMCAQRHWACSIAGSLFPQIPSHLRK